MGRLLSQAEMRLKNSVAENAASSEKMKQRGFPRHISQEELAEKTKQYTH